MNTPRASKPRPVTADEWIAQAGVFNGVSNWHAVSQQRIDAFADATGDHQFIHVDPNRAKSETPFNGTIAHGFLTLSMITIMALETVPPLRDVKMGINYGFEKIRFLTPVAAGSRIRGRFALTECGFRNPGELLSRFDVQVEIENTAKPALFAEWLTIRIMN